MNIRYAKGDIVRCTADYPSSFTKGNRYVVREGYDELVGSTRSLLVEEDDKGSRTNGWNAMHFEPSEAPKSILGTQVGGTHYTDCAIQPIEYIWANKLGFSEGNIVKYVTRWKSKGGIKDLEKARHHISLLIEHEERKNLNVV